MLRAALEKNSKEQHLFPPTLVASNQIVLPIKILFFAKFVLASAFGKNCLELQLVVAILRSKCCDELREDSF